MSAATIGDATALARLAAAALDADALARGVSIRAAALLARQALEAAVDLRLAALAGVEADGSTRARLLALTHLDPDAGTEASQLWWSLTRACHQHHYELRPTRAEVGSMVDRAVAWIVRDEAVPEGVG